MGDDIPAIGATLRNKSSLRFFCDNGIFIKVLNHSILEVNKSMNRGAIIALVFILAIGLAGYFIFYDEERSFKVADRDFYCREVKTIRPPSYTLKKGPQNRIARFLDRLVWGTNESVNWTIECLKEEKKKSFVLVDITRIRMAKSSNFPRAKRYIDLLAELDDPNTLPFLIECTNDTSKMVRHAALKGVSRFEEEKAAVCILQHLSTSPYPETKNLCMSLASNIMNPLVLDFFIKVLEEGKENFLVLH